MRKFTFFLALMVAMVTTAFAQTPVLELTADEIGTSYPKQLSDEDAAKVYALENLTIAVEISTKSVSGRMSLFATSSPGTAANTGAKGTGSPYVGYGMNGSDVGYLASWRSGDRFTGKSSSIGLPANTDGAIVTYVINRSSNSFRVFVNGVQERTWDNAHADGFMSGYEIATPGMVKADYADAQIYIGGAKNSAGYGEVFNGTITGIKVYDAALSNAEVAAINFEDPALLAAAQAEFNTAYAAAQAILDEAELVVNRTKLPLQANDATAAYYLWCNKPEANEGDINSLFDGSVGAKGGKWDFFHTNWSDGNNQPRYHYIEVDLGEGNSINEFEFGYNTRNNDGIDFPDAIQVVGSNQKDGEYAEIYNVTTGLPQGAALRWDSPSIVSNTAYRYIRFNVDAERTYWHMSEFEMFTSNVTVAEKYNKVAIEVANLKNLCDSHAGNASYNTAKLTAAAAAISAAVEAVNAGVAVPVIFEVYALDGMMNPSPLEGTVSSLGYVVFAASDNNAVLAEASDAPKVGIFDTEKQSYVAEASSIMFGDLLSNGMQLVAVQFDGFNTPGKYKVHAPAGAFTVNGKPSEEIISAEFTILVKAYAVESVTPADKEEVEAIDKIEINFTEDIALATDNMGLFIPVNLVDENDNVIELAVSDDTNVWSKVVLTPATPITAAGTYTLDLSQLQLNGGVCEGSYSWTVVEPVIPLAVVSVDPAEAVESFSSITIEFNKDIKLLWEAPDAGGTGTSGTGTSGTGTSGTGTSGTGTSGTGTSGTGTSGTGTSDVIKLFNSANGVAASAWFRNATVNGNKITFKLDATVKTSGTYTFAVPAGLIASTDDESFAGQTFAFTVDAAPAMTSPTSSSKNFELKIDENLVFEFSDEIEFASGFEKFQLMVKGSDVVAAEFVVGESAVISGKVLTLKVTNAIVPEETTSYTLSIPANAIVKKGSDKAFAGKNMTYNVKAFQIKSVDPVSGSTVQEFSQISIEFNEAVYNYGLNTLTLTNVADNSIKIALTGVANGKILTLTANGTVSDGTYKLNGLGNIVNNSYNPIVGASGYEYTITVAAPVVELAALEATNATRNPAESEWDPSKSYYLQGVKLDFAEAVKKADGVTEFGCIYNANGEQVAVLDKILGANGTAKYATPYVATKITTAGTYKVVVKSGVILSADGTKEYKGGEFEFTVAKKPATLIPSAEDGLFYNASFTSVDEFKTQQIVVSGADEVTVSEEVNITMTSGENVYTATVTVEDKDGDKVINIVFPDEDYAAGRYTINIPAGAFLVDGVANAEYYPSNFTYSKPQLKVTKDWTSWEALFTEKYMMPREVAIAINNAESVTVAENMVATLTVGETTYNSTVSFTSEENNYWITFKFAEIQAIYEDENADFVKGEYTFTVPAGLYTVNDEANVEETKTFTYGAAVVEEFTVTSISPAVGNVTELNRIEIAFSNDTKPEQLILTNGDERFFFIAKDGAYVAVDPLKDYAEITITELGTYTLDLSELDGLTGDKVFSWTIAATPTLNETVVFDFANNDWGITTEGVGNVFSIKTAGDYTDGINTIHIDPTANNGSYIYKSNGFLQLGKPGSKIVLPAFDFAVEKIEVVGHSSATSYPNVDMNVYVGDVAVSTACIGSTATSTFAIAADNQAAGNVYELVIGSNGGSYSSVMYITYIKVYPAENKLEAPVIDLASGVYVGEQTVNAHSATTDIEGVTNVTYFYTLDGNEPTTEDEESVDGVITITNSCTLKVIVEFTLGEKTYVSASTSAEYIITEEATYHRAVAVESGNYFLVADGKVAAPIEGTTLPAVEVTVEGNDVTAPVYYAITLEKTDAGYYIKDVNGNYIYNTMMNPNKLASGTYAPMDAWTIEIADDENSTATIMCNGYALAFNKGVFCTVQLGGTDVPVMPTLYGTYATGINEAVVNGEAIESIYDLTGRKIEKITKSGIYIVNGKKVLVK